MGTVWWFFTLAKEAAHGIQSLAQAPQQMIAGLQRQKRTDRLRGALYRNVGQQPAEQLPEQRGGDRVAWENLSQKNGERSTTTLALAAIGTKDPLPPRQSTIGSGGIVAIKEAVPV